MEATDTLAERYNLHASIMRFAPVAGTTREAAPDSAGICRLSPHFPAIPDYLWERVRPKEWLAGVAEIGISHSHFARSAFMIGNTVGSQGNAAFAVAGLS